MTAPGWYNDAQDPSRARWHDGDGWTEHTMAKADWRGRGSPPPPKPAPAGPALGRSDRPSPWADDPAPLSDPSRGRREWPSGHFVGALLAMITAAVCLLILQRIDEDADAVAATTTTTTLPSTTAEWQTVDGSNYRITVTPSSVGSDQASTNGCVGAPTEGHTNVAFTIRLENLSPNQQAPRPQVSFGVNVGASGALDPAITTLDNAGTAVEVGPVEAGTSCSLARSIVSGSGEALGPAGFADFAGVVGGVPSPVPEGLVLIVRYFPADDAQVARGTGFTKVDLLVPFPKAPVTTQS